MRLFLNVVRTWARSSGDVVERVARLWQRGVGQPHRVAGRRRAARAAAPARPAGGAQPSAARARRRLRAHAAAAAAVSTTYTPRLTYPIRDNATLIYFLINKLYEHLQPILRDLPRLGDHASAKSPKYRQFQNKNNKIYFSTEFHLRYRFERKLTSSF